MQPKLVKFPAIFTPLHPLPLEWKGIECQFIQAKAKHTYDIHTCGPFLYLIPTGKKAHQFMIFTPNHSCSKPKEEKKNKFILPIHSPFKIIPTLAFVSSKEKVLLEIMDYIKKINDDTNNFLITMRINENIANNEFQQFSEDLTKPINVVSSIQYIRHQFRFQTLEKETGKQNLDFELKQSNIVVFPCIDLPHKFGNNDFAIMSFCLFTSQQKAYFFKTPNQNEMTKWILYLHIYSNRIESNPNDLLSKLVTQPASPPPQQSKQSSAKTIQKPTTAPNTGMKPRPLKKVATTFAALPITPTETPKKTLKKRPQQTIQQTSQSQPITVKPLSDIFATSKNDEDEDDNDFSMQVENLSIEIKQPEEEKNEQETENENDPNAQTENPQLSIPISPRSSFGRRLSLHESSVAHFINKDKQNQDSENIGFNIPPDYQQRAEKSLHEYEEEHKQLTVKKDVFTPPDFDELISKSIVSMSTVISEDTRAMQIQTLINSIHDDNTNEIVDFSFIDQSDEEIVQTTLNEMKDEDTIHLSQFFNFKEFPEYDQEALINSSRPFNPLYSEFTAIDQGLRQSGSSGLTLTNPYASKLCFLVACVLVNGLKEFSDQSSTVSLVGPFTDLMTILPDLESVVTEIRNEELTLAQASIASTILIKKNTLGIFLREAKRNDEWISKYYLNSSLMANYEFLETFVLMLEPMLNTMTFNIAVTPNIFKGMPEDEINRFALTPMFAYLEINDLFKPGANAAKIIAKQFDVGLKKRGRFLSISSWDVLDKISQGQKKSTLSKDFSNSVGASPNLFGAANFFGKASSNLESWVSIAIQNEKIHVWFLLVHVNLILMGNPYYYEEASLNDPYRVNYITKKIYKFFSNLR